MNKLTLLLILVSGFLVATAQEDRETYEISTIISKSHSNGWYGALSFNYTEIDGKDAFLVGARGAWIMDHSFAIGVGGCGFVNDINYDNWRDNDLNYNLAGGYGGLYLEPIIAPRLPVHLSFPILFGVGGIARIDDHHDWGSNWINDDSNEDAFLILEPAVELEFNMTRHLRLGASLSYRFTSKIELNDTDPDILEGASVGLIMKFGKF